MFFFKLNYNLLFESYQRLGVSFTDTHFESDYSEKVKDVLTLLREKDLVQFEWVCVIYFLFLFEKSVIYQGTMFSVYSLYLMAFSPPSTKILESHCFLFVLVAFVPSSRSWYSLTSDSKCSNDSFVSGTL